MSSYISQTVELLCVTPSETAARCVVVVDTSRGMEQQGEDGGVVIDVEVETEDMDPHDSQMITQEISEDEADDVGQGRTWSGSSLSLLLFFSRGV